MEEVHGFEHALQLHAGALQFLPLGCGGECTCDLGGAPRCGNHARRLARAAPPSTLRRGRRLRFVPLPSARCPRKVSDGHQGLLGQGMHLSNGHGVQVARNPKPRGDVLLLVEFGRPRF